MDKFLFKCIALGTIYIIAIILTILDFIKKYKKAKDGTEKYKYVFHIFIRIISSTIFLILFISLILKH